MLIKEVADFVLDGGLVVDHIWVVRGVIVLRESVEFILCVCVCVRACVCVCVRAWVRACVWDG